MPSRSFVVALGLVAAAAPGAAFVLPGSPRAVGGPGALGAQSHVQKPVAGRAPENPGSKCFSLLMGFALGLVVAAQAAIAGTGANRPIFQLARPDYMQGIDAANAATRPGYIDYVTRSRMEALQLAQANKEAAMAAKKLASAEPKEERVKRVQTALKKLAKGAEQTGELSRL